jgi:Ca-activated chloride channel family protein
MLGKYRGSPEGAVVVRGKSAQGPFERRIELKEAKASPDNAALRLLWARQRLMGLVDFSHFARGNQEVEKEVTALGLKYSLMSPYTSFVAVDKLKRADGQVVTVKQPLPLPAGVSDLAVGQGRPGAVMPSMMPYRAGPVRELSKKVKTPQPGYDAAAEGGVRQVEPGFSGTTETVQVAIRDVQTKAGLTPAAVRKVLEAELAKLSRCCQDAVKSGFKLPAEITLVFTVDTGGKVSAAPVGKPPLANQDFENCLAATFRGLQFSKPLKAPVQVTVKLALTVK